MNVFNDLIVEVGGDATNTTAVLDVMVLYQV